MIPQNVTEVLTEFPVLGQAFQGCHELPYRLPYNANTLGLKEAVGGSRRLRVVVVPENEESLQRHTLNFGGLDQVSKGGVRLDFGRQQLKKVACTLCRQHSLPQHTLADVQSKVAIHLLLRQSFQLNGRKV